MAGAASGLFVGARRRIEHLGTHLPGVSGADDAERRDRVLSWNGYAAAAFHEPAKDGGSGIDAAEFLERRGTFLAALTAFVSVILIVVRQDLHVFWTVAILSGMGVRRDHADRGRRNRAGAQLAAAAKPTLPAAPFRSS